MPPRRREADISATSRIDIAGEGDESGEGNRRATARVDVYGSIADFLDRIGDLRLLRERESDVRHDFGCDERTRRWGVFETIRSELRRAGSSRAPVKANSYAAAKLEDRQVIRESASGRRGCAHDPPGSGDAPDDAAELAQLVFLRTLVRYALKAKSGALAMGTEAAKQAVERMARQQARNVKRAAGAIFRRRMPSRDSCGGDANEWHAQTTETPEDLLLRREAAQTAHELMEAAGMRLKEREVLLDLMRLGAASIAEDEGEKPERLRLLLHRRLKRMRRLAVARPNK